MFGCCPVSLAKPAAQFRLQGRHELRIGLQHLLQLDRILCQLLQFKQAAVIYWPMAESSAGQHCQVAGG